MMGKMSTQNNQFGNAAFSPSSLFPYAPPPTSSTSTSTPGGSQPVTVDVPVTKVEETPATDTKDGSEAKKETKKYAFVDVSLDETFQKTASERYKESAVADSVKESVVVNYGSQNGAASKPEEGVSQDSSSKRQANSLLSVEALEQMMEDPTVQKMVYPNNMGGSPEWDNHMMDTSKNFDLNSPEVKQQFDQIGLIPEEVISKIMANPDVAMAFQNPRVQAAIMDCSQNPLSIAKYQNDKEVMDVFNKISELFPGVTDDEEEMEFHDALGEQDETTGHPGQLKYKDCEPLSTTIVYDSVVSSFGSCPKVQWKIQEYSFQYDLRVMDLGGRDIILGVDWMCQYSPITFDLQQLQIKMSKEEASSARIGAVLMQANHPIAHLSKGLCLRNNGLYIYEKELLAIVMAVSKWKHYVLGHHFIIKTDHQSLKCLLEQKLTSTLQHRWFTKLLGLDYEIQYEKGAENKVADALSRRIPEEDNELPSTSVVAISSIKSDWMQEVLRSYD
ncbi:hypothetical protein ACH5RR_026219 [Cinchona calisaya]|uniref:Protein TIC 40, chloroplastic n=1 Tax=Cinchona calisaya TaxID=153742 RepID=A0ABD2Z561_9GENT